MNEACCLSHFGVIDSLFFNCLKDNLYGNHSAGPAANAADSSGPDCAGYGTFYPDGSNVSSAPAHIHPPGADGSPNSAGNYKAMPPPADKESPYSYGYGEEKKKILTQSEGQGDNYSMYSTAYPSSVTGGQGYSNYGKEPCKEFFFKEVEKNAESKRSEYKYI